MREIKLSNTDKLALVDADDFDRCSIYTWYLDVRGYVVAWTGTTHKYLHSFLLDAPPKEIVDHKNRNPLDCRKSNMRFATKRQNACNSKVRTDNTSGYKGVCWNKSLNRWIARVYVYGKQVHAGRAHTKEEAARMYDRAAREHYGEFACLNFPDEEAA